MHKNKLPYKLKALERDIILFKWKSDSLKLPLNPEFYLTELGSLGYDKVHKCWVKGTFNGILDDYGDFTTYVCHTLNTENVKSYELRNHEEVIVCGNTPLYRPFVEERKFYDEMKTEADFSIFCQILNTRFSKAAIAPNDNVKKAIINAYKNAYDGQPLTITTSILEDLQFVDLTNPQEVDKIQYLTSFFQSIDKREANDSGIDLENMDKRAQVSTTEIKQYDDYTTIQFLIMYEMRLRFMEEMKENGFNIEIVKNPIFFDEPEKKDIEEGTFESEEAPEAPEENNNESEGGEDGNENN